MGVLVERGMRRINGGIIKMRQEELFGWQITNGGLRNLRKKKWKIGKKKIKIKIKIKMKIELVNYRYGIYAL